MATLLSPRDDELARDSISANDQAVTRGLGMRETSTSRGHALNLGLLEPPLANSVLGARFRPIQREDEADDVSPSYVRGVSLSGVLQMLNLERKTCVLEVSSESRFGALTLVNGVLVDADVDGSEGEEAVYRVLSWNRPQTTIMDGVGLFRHTVELPISQLLLESVRRQDEAERANRSEAVPANDGRMPATRSRDPNGSETTASQSEWQWMVETLIIGGARKAAIIRARDELLLALADEFGGPASDPSQTEVAELSAIARSARRWSRIVDPAVTEIVVRAGERQVLVSPIDSAQTTFAYAEVDGSESLDLVRRAIRAMIR